MAKTNYRIAVVGAGSLLGKEIGDEIAESPLASAVTVLLDNEESSGVLESMGDEAAFLQAMEPAALENVDVAIFADAKMLREHEGTARAMGAAVVDATGTDVAAPVRLPVVAAPLDLETAVVRVAHPVTTMLVLALLQAGKVAPVKATYATVLQPASENGRAALDELQQQSINLLNFQSAPTEEFDTQVAFNLLPALGESAKNPLVLTEERVVREWKTLLPGAPVPTLQWLQAPVFHGYSVSLFVEFKDPVTLEAVSGAMASEWMDLVGEEGDPPSNLSSAGQGQVLVQVKGEGTRYAIWLAADNLKLMARTAVACALELTKMRPLGKVQ
ncbi:MAG: Asd/ArgC dimerization domain-containing protein [Terriglobus sp.]